MHATASRIRLTTMNPPASNPGCLARSTKLATLAAALAIGLAGAAPARAIGLDEISQQSGLGEPLRLVIPVLSSGDEASGDEFAGECFKVVPAAVNDLPQPALARAALERRAGRAFVVLTTAYPITEPMMRVAVKAGCRISVSREYTVLFDPVAIEAPVAQVAAAPQARPAAVAVATTARADTSASTAAPASTEPPVAQRSVAPRKQPARAAQMKPESGSRRDNGAITRRAPSQSRAASSSAGPRLQVSRTADYAAMPPVAGSPPSSAAEREMLRTVEEQAVVLQKQIAELTLAMERMQQELVAARAARDEAEKAAAPAAARPAVAASSPAVRSWMTDNWPLLVLVPALIFLIAALLVKQRRRESPRIPAPLTPAQAEAFNLADLGEPSVPGHPDFRNAEIVVTSRFADKPPRMIRSAILDPTASVTEPKYDPGIAFDYEVEQAAEESSAYSILEREQPGIIARLTDTWGTPYAEQKLQDYLLTPRRGGRVLSRGAIEELKLLHAIAIEHSGGPGHLPIGAQGGNGQWNAGSRRM